MQCAIQHPQYAKMATLPSGLTVTKDEAAKQGFVIARDGAHARSIAEHAGHATADGSTYLDQLRTLPEAADRPLAIAKLAHAYTLKSMPLAKAALFLSGLPIETAETQPEPKKMSLEDEMRLRRKVEIQHLGRSRRGALGDGAAKAEAKKLGYALQIHNMSANKSMSMALREAGIDPSTVN